MRVKLKILDGKNAGKEIKLPRGKFLIGRHEECDLRPSSDSVSRRHCVITVKDGDVYVRDLNSRNGTVVNGQKITDKTFLKMGDDLVIGRLKFQVVVDHGIGGEKKATVANVQEAMARTAESKPKSQEDFDVDAWLTEADDRVVADPETRQFTMDETNKVILKKQSEDEQAGADAEKDEPEQKPEKKKPGKLPRNVMKSENSQAAAADMLKKLFNAR